MTSINTKRLTLKIFLRKRATRSKKNMIRIKYYAVAVSTFTMMRHKSSFLKLNLIMIKVLLSLIISRKEMYKRRTNEIPRFLN